jgi:ParB family chromosome partitioning protein
LISLNGWNAKELADALHINPSKVTRALSLLKLPDDIQEQVAEGVVSATAAYEISRIPNDETRRTLAKQAAEGELTREDAAKAVRQRKGKAKSTRGIKQTFLGYEGWKVIVTTNRKADYPEMELALGAALEEVRHRIKNGRTLL